MKKMQAVLLASMLGVCGISARGEIRTYDIGGVTYLGGEAHRFTGVFEYESNVASQTVYFNGEVIPQQGFRSTYGGAVRGLSIVLDNGDAVSCGPGGAIDVNNMQQVEAGSQVPGGLSVQAWAGNSSGTIEGLQVRYMYLAFLPQDPGFGWDALDSYFSGNAEQMLIDDPTLLPRDINTAWTGTELDRSIEQLGSGLFLGTIHGSTTTVNMIDRFELRVPGPGVCALGVPAGILACRRRRR